MFCTVKRKINNLPKGAILAYNEMCYLKPGVTEVHDEPNKATGACELYEATEACETYEVTEACEPYEANEACEP